ncbi:uncharacterized protein LOC117644329 isoform X2 [Thrips palmi]|uniref:Uncharacterized protein LOC117644329 isoform X2 n=1 Tax=Thrips palmi TaxID=161013 RepID=A0A6P8YQJ3_THRPL|nr:uncharacterized protein LOC117644329 isoform X2 [Thrips palmi]XP_034239576.1 uncharacterized protein LOC117644329 isoform X2 [Thrips palmi]XP_034239577.1 uncharacterized protein LOC117644329 isoform X2 [Thrips palmi]
MTSLFGIPLCGSLFLPLIIGIATVSFFWTFVFSKKGLKCNAEDRGEMKTNSVPKEKVFLETKKKAKDKGKKKCGSSGGCCSKKDGKSGGCSDSNQSIQSAKVFLDKQSNICQEFAGVLAKPLSENIATELLNISHTESVNLTEHADGSLCIFIIDTSISNGQPHWLLRALSNLASTERPLSGMKYSVFTLQDAPLESKAEPVDQFLHKSGAVRVCRAEIAEITAALSSNVFDDWAEEVLSRIQLWNSPKKKSCKCGPKEKVKESCSSSDCSSDDEDGRNSSPSEPILDLEDIAKLL